jgi:hypothetical protein
MTTTFLTVVIVSISFHSSGSVDRSTKITSSSAWLAM